MTFKERGFILSSISEIQDHSNGNCLAHGKIFMTEVKKRSQTKRHQSRKMIKVSVLVFITVPMVE